MHEVEIGAKAGNGINDAPALAAAHAGVAMGAVGTDVALETVDVASMAYDLEKLSLEARLRRAAVAQVARHGEQVIAVALVIKVVFLVVVAVFGPATLWMAVAADMGGSLLVVTNGLRAAPVEGTVRWRGGLT